MPTRLPVPVREIISLLSSPPLPRHSPPPTTAMKDQDPFLSSPLPPSPSAMFSAFAAKAREAQGSKAQGSKGKVEKSSIWNIPDDVRDLELLPPATENKRASKAAEHAGARKPKTRKATEKSKAEKKAPLKNGRIQAKVVKSPLETGKKSKYFPEKQQELSDILGPVPKNAALAPKPPNQRLRHEPPLHVIRRQWTPVKDTDFPFEGSPHLANGEPKMDKIGVFSSVINSMRYSTESSENARETSFSMDNRAENVLVNKRAIEMIGLPNSVGVTGLPKPKPKPPIRKRKTITDQATASYRTATDSPLLRHFPVHEIPPIAEDEDSQKCPPRKTGSPAKKKRKSETETVVLLSPTGARKRFDSQEFVFGTCSQLERTGEDGVGLTYDSQSRTMFDGQNVDYCGQLPPPSTSVARRGFLKTLAIDRKGGSSLRSDSGEIGNRVDGRHDVSVTEVQEQPTKQRESQLSKFQGAGGSLWNAAARDSNGGLLDVEFVDMTGGEYGDSEPRRNEDNDLLRGAVGNAAIGRSATPNATEESCQSIRRELQIVEGTIAAHENDPTQTIRIPRDSSQARPTSATLLLSSRTINPIPARPPGDSFRSISSRATTPPVAPAEIQPNPASPVLNPVAQKAKKSKKTKPAPVMPDFQSYHLTKLKTEVAKFGFKNMRTRDRMISCLERCWDAQNKTSTAAALQSAEANELGPVINTTGLSQQDAGEEEAVPALHLQDDPTMVPPPKKPRAHVKQKKTEKEKATPKSPKRKAEPKKKPPPPKAVPQSSDETVGFIDLSAEPSSPKKCAPKARTRKTSALPPSPKSAVFTSTELHCRISKVVRESGRNGSKFSFYHSMLMYDPIILEDMALWLNSMLHPETIDVEDVKAWCEANGVCCVRSESLRVRRAQKKR